MLGYFDVSHNFLYIPRKLEYKMLVTYKHTYMHTYIQSNVHRAIHSLVNIYGKSAIFYLLHSHNLTNNSFITYIHTLISSIYTRAHTYSFHYVLFLPFLDHTSLPPTPSYGKKLHLAFSFFFFCLLLIF